MHKSIFDNAAQYCLQHPEKNAYDTFNDFCEVNKIRLSFTEAKELVELIKNTRSINRKKIEMIPEIIKKKESKKNG